MSPKSRHFPCGVTLQVLVTKQKKVFIFSIMVEFHVAQTHYRLKRFLTWKNLKLTYSREWQVVEVNDLKHLATGAGDTIKSTIYNKKFSVMPVSAYSLIVTRLYVVDCLDLEF
jgi:hypothetical protein